MTITGTGYDGSSGNVTVNGVVVNSESHPALAHVFEIGAVCNNADVSNGKAIGQPTEAALVAAAQKMGLNAPRDRHTRTHEVCCWPLNFCCASDCTDAAD